MEAEDGKRETGGREELTIRCPAAPPQTSEEHMKCSCCTPTQLPTLLEHAKPVLNPFLERAALFPAYCTKKRENQEADELG